jgi:quercetin dioxygenase-like cupin family protein
LWKKVDNGDDGAVQQATLGKRLRTLRGARKLTLEEVAQATGISRSFLSLVETGQSDITTSRLIDLMEFYGISFTNLLPGHALERGDGHASEVVEVVRAHECEHIESPAEGLTVSLLMPTAGRQLMVARLDFEPGAHMLEPAHHRGEEIVHVLDGELTIELAGREPARLVAGDTIHYPATLPHAYRNAADGGSRALVVVTPPTY